MEIGEIIEEFKYYTGKFPKEAVEEAIKKEEQIIPELIKIMEYSVAHIKEIKEDNDDYMGFLYAMFLLSQFRVKKGFPLVIDFFTALEGDEYWFCGDFVTENLPGVLASLFDGNTKPLLEIINNPKIDEFIRNSAFQSLVILYLYKDICREEMLEYVRNFIKNPDVKREYYLIGEIAYTASELYLKELFDDIKKLYDEELIDRIENPYEDIVMKFSGTEEKASIRIRKSQYHTKITDTIKEMEWWACFNEENDIDVNYTEEDEEEFIEDLDAGIPYIRESPKIGRNDPCPCGSGKKYKHCCGA